MRKYSTIRTLTTGDTDGNLFPDGWEINNGYNANSSTDPDPAGDSDSDGLTNLEEFQQNTDPWIPDSRKKHTYDGGGHMVIEIISAEMVSDRMRITIAYPDDFTNRLDIIRSSNLLDGWQLVATVDADLDLHRTVWTDSEGGEVFFYKALDTFDGDGDGLPNGREKYLYKTDPFNSDSDSDGMPDGWELNNGLNPLLNDSAWDIDGDGLTNLQEYQTGTDPTNSDTDGDELADSDEVQIHGTDPNNPDTDYDEMADGWEVQYGLNPLDLADATTDLDADGASNLQEYQNGTDPTTDNSHDYLPFSEGFEPNIVSVETKLTGSDSVTNDNFGSAVGIYDDTVIVGAWGDDDNGNNSGSAYIFKGQGWVQQAKLTASDGAAGDFFGRSVAVYDDRAIIGTEAEKAYVFKWNGGSWVEEMKLTTTNAVSGDRFGFSVDIQGDTAIIGALYAGYTGRAFIFNRSGTNWTEHVMLIPSGGGTGDRFGCSVSLCGDTAIVGADCDDENGQDSGSAYIFKGQGTNWTQEAKLMASDGGAMGWFGWSVGISSNTAIVGAVGTEKTYIFRRDGTNWTEEAKLTASDSESGHYFGYSVGIFGDTAIVGGENCNSAYIFTRFGTNWTQESILTASDGEALDMFGRSVTIYGDTAVVGALYDDDDGINSGSAYVYDMTLTRPGFSAGYLNNQEGWTQSYYTCYIQTNVVNSGKQALRIYAWTSPVTVHHDLYGAIGASQVSEDFFIQPQRWGEGETPEVTDTATAVYYVNNEGQLVVYDGSLEKNNWVTLANHEAITTSTWVRLMVVHDFTNQDWSIWLNGSLVEGNIGFANSISTYSGITFTGGKGGSTYIDDINISWDSDGDGMPDWWEAQHGVDDPDLDPDNDGLTNLEEYQNGTDPNNWDTDGDLISDGLEVEYGMDPTEADDPDADPDDDGLSNFDEICHGTDPTDPDSDGDGVSDSDEVDQGSDPTDPSDNGEAPEGGDIVEIELVVGDNSGSHSERYELTVGSNTIHHQSPEFGQLYTNTYKFIRGKAYPFEVKWMASKFSTPDYDYTATIGGFRSGAPEPGWGSGDGFLIDDSQGLLGTTPESGGEVNTAAGKSGTLYVIASDLDGRDASTAEDVPEETEETEGILVMDSLTIPPAKLIVRSCSVTGLTRVVSFSDYSKVRVDGEAIVGQLTVPVDSDQEHMYEVTQEGTWAVSNTVVATLTVKWAGYEMDADMVKLVACKVEITGHNTYTNPATLDETKYMVATIPERENTNPWSAELHGTDERLDANLKYRRSGSETDVAWEGTPEDLYFTNGELNVDIVLLDGSDSTPKMAINSGVLEVNSVQQGDRIIIEEPTSGCRDELAVVKNFTWNDLQSLGTNNLAFAPEYSSLNADWRESIVNTVVFCLDQNPGRAQEVQRTNNVMADIKSLTNYYTNFRTTYTNVCRLNIPSALGIGFSPDDYEHWHIGLMTNQLDLPSDIATVQTSIMALNAIYTNDFDTMEAALRPSLIELMNKCASSPIPSLAVSHTYERVHDNEKYVDPEGSKKILVGDPIRNIRTVLSDKKPTLFFTGDENSAEWDFDPPCHVWQAKFFVNRNGRIVMYGSLKDVFERLAQVVDACKED